MKVIIEPALRAHLAKSLTPQGINALLTTEWQFSKRKALMERDRLWLPADLQSKVMSLRMSAHENAVITKTQAKTAIEIVEQLASRYAPLKSPSSRHRRLTTTHGYVDDGARA